MRVIKVFDAPWLEIIDGTGPVSTSAAKLLLYGLGGDRSTVPSRLSFRDSTRLQGAVLKYSDGSILQGEGGEETVLDGLAITSGHRPLW